ncbi:dTMP kinase [Fructilactobacillus florum]|uniref:dTMP kinase n=1 Tax=Fructilactobacillus florum TaxID=640331 RepID=UPI00028E35D8|nr:dTMP kinase [Fructilactobacillus florum]EKK20036.1 Thymidylate kinase [Fructilactobacillus florum 2F]
MTGKLITFEGLDGSGKTTVMQQVVQDLIPRLGAQLVTTREPGGDQLAEQIRSFIFDHNNALDPRSMALLFAAARRQHLTRRILPALHNNQLILCDRYLDSSLAYQGGGQQLGIENILEMNQFATEGVLPTLTFYLKLPVAVALERIQTRETKQQNQLDQQQRDFYVRVQTAYDKIAANNPQRMVVIDATQPVAVVTQKVLAVISQQFASYFL